MGILEKFFPAKSTITGDAIRSRIADAESEITAHRNKIGKALADVAAMSDSEHVKIQGEIAASERAITRLEALVAHLSAELPAVVTAEEATAKASTDDALRQRTKAAEKAAGVEARKLLESYNEHAAAIADVLSRLNEIQKETDSVNQALRVNPVAEHVQGYNEVHRKHPDTQASEHRGVRWVYVYPDGTEEPAVLDRDGNPKRPEPKWIHHDQKFVNARIEQREIVTARTDFRPGRYELGLSAVVLPPGFAGGSGHWPRQS